ncbi:MAG: stage III sporulation protein AA [Oscillospiraceae bacterium]|nr:stage III sporulation protein AA [Oscillospiraceae bacterium]
MDSLERGLGLLPISLRARAAERIPKDAEELRLRVGRPPSYLAEGREAPFAEERVDEELLLRVLEKATAASIHTAAGALAEGYWCYHGLRIGLCGTAIRRDGVVNGFRELSSLAIRIPRERRGICDATIGCIADPAFRNTLLLSRPGGGKTTALRELIRLLSERGYRICVADERNEIAAKDGAVQQFDLGPCTDVLTGMDKAAAARMLLRSMSPQILAMDEIASADEMRAVFTAVGSGTGILASVHAPSVAELRRRPGLRDLLASGAFSLALCIEGNGKGRSYRLEEIPA